MGTIMTKETKVTTIAEAFLKAQKEFGPILKTSNNPFFKSKYADLASCIDSILGALNNNGISLIQNTHPSESGVAVETILLHESGEKISGGILEMPAIKRDPQAYGSALTYARRYSLMCTVGIAPEDDDGNKASQAKNVVHKSIDSYLKDISSCTDINELKDVYSAAMHNLSDEVSKDKLTKAKDEAKQRIMSSH